MSSDQNTYESIPELKPEREDIERRQGQGGRGGGNKPPPKPAKSSSGAWLLVLLCLAGLAGLAAWTWTLNEQLQGSRLQLADAAQRVEKLEQRLSVTDESVNQSSVEMQVKIKEMDGEIRKLWDNVWKKAKEDLARHDTTISALQAQLKGQVASQAELGAQFTGEIAEAKLALKVLSDQVESGAQLADKLEALQEELARQEKSLEEMNETADALVAASGDMKKRLAATEEWVDSFNGYRTQINRKLLDVQGSINALQGQ
jgi:chromosome segregation ATPase